MSGFYYYGKSFFHEYEFDGGEYTHTLTSLDSDFSETYVCKKREYDDRFDKVKKGILKTV